MDYPDMDRIYRDLPPAAIPWNIETPPDLLVDLVERGMVRPCRAVDLGCGTGNYARYLAGRGFDVTGLDSSPTAIRIARKNAEMHGQSLRFVVADLLGDLPDGLGTFGFGFDWELLHHIFPEDRGRYLSNVHRILDPDALYLSVSFSEEDSQFGGTGKYRKTRVGTTLYFSSENEVRNLVSQFFSVIDCRTLDIAGKTGPHRAVMVLSTLQR